jgi:hypothetical protein
MDYYITVYGASLNVVYLILFWVGSGLFMGAVAFERDKSLYTLGDLIYMLIIFGIVSYVLLISLWTLSAIKYIYRLMCRLSSIKLRDKP